ncbi:MAG: hypothetical protein FWC54_01185 [Actinomycetia bacterium]|nr:hypothetical protein [Actinomycetes bacterium]
MPTTSPLIIVPTFWGKQQGRRSSEQSQTKRDSQTMSAGTQAFYEHPSSLDELNPPLQRLLESLTHVRSPFQVALIVNTNDRSVEVRADERVREIARQFPQLNTFVFGPTELGSLSRRLEQLEMLDMVPALSLRSYGATRNLGLLVAAIKGCDKVIFLDDDCVVDDPLFLEKALFGLGAAIKETGGHLLGKTGLTMNAKGRYLTEEGNRATDRFWHWDKSRNSAISELLRPPRLTPAKLAFGGCLALHAGLFARVSFDAWITRGEDTDYVINARLFGSQLFADDQWSVLHLPGEGVSRPLRFRQDVFGYIYEHRKLEFAKSQVDLKQVTAEQLSPYPGDFIDGSAGMRARITALLRALVGPERGAYWQAALHVVSDATRYACAHCADYFAFQRKWPTLVERLWRDVALGSLFSGERTVDRTALTGSFKAIEADAGAAREAPAEARAGDRR